MSKTINIRKKIQSDIFGVFISGLCAIHCTLMPVFFAAKPLLESSNITHQNESELWESLDYIFLILSLVAVWYSSIHSFQKFIKWFLWLSWLVFSVGLMSEHYDFSYGIWLMYIGSFCLIIGHSINYRYCKKCEIKNI